MRAGKDLTMLAMAAFTAFAAGCGGDVDQDGVSEADGDCNDHNDAVYPGARERGGDAVDSDCDGEDTPVLGDDLYDDALPLLDTDQDDEVSLDEFDAACVESAMLFGEANPGVTQTHAACAGTSSCRGMILNLWPALFEHDCRGANACLGYSCVETAQGSGRDGATGYSDAACSACHTGKDGAFLVHVPEGEDPDGWLATFLDRSDDEFRAAIAFGVAGISADGVAYTNMPGHHEVLSRAEMDSVIAYVRGMEMTLEEPPEEED